MDSRDAALIDRIRTLKSARKAIILAHNCQSAEIQDIADFVGDSWEIVCRAREATADVVVVCGVSYIAEMVAVACPGKTVLQPDPLAACPLAEMITADELKRTRREHPGAKVVCYIKSPAAVKAESDVCCTSANAREIVRRLGAAQEIIFVPDLYLGDEVCQDLGRDLTLWPGYCPSTGKILPQDILTLKQEYPAARVIAHVQCTPQVKTLADAVGNTAELVRYAGRDDVVEVIVACETGLIHRLERAYPGKKFIPAADRAVCGKARMINLEKVLWSLESGNEVVRLPEGVRRRALAALEAMSKLCPQPEGLIKTT